MASTIDSATKVNLGILTTLLAAIAAGGAYFGTLRGDLTRLGQSIERMERAVEKIASQAQVDGRDLSSLRTRLASLEERVRTLEQQKRD